MTADHSDASPATGRTAPSAHPTIRDVAARAGVSKSLVSLALQNAPRVAPTTREAILAAAEELGYRRNAAARALGAHRTRTIGVFVLDLHNPISADLLDAVQAEARRRDYCTIVVVGGDDATAERAELTPRLDERVLGMWASGLLAEVEQLIPAGLERGVTASRAIGYAQALGQLHGSLTEAEAIEQTQQLTRRYARRQVSWFKRGVDTHWIDSAANDRVEQALQLVDLGAVAAAT